MWLFRVFFALIVLLPLTPLSAQEEPPSTDPSKQFFAGNVLEVSDSKITVARTILGKTTATKSFIINPETKVEGKLRLKAKVTVRYAASDDGDVAVQIIVRK